LDDLRVTHFGCLAPCAAAVARWLVDWLGSSRRKNCQPTALEESARLDLSTQRRNGAAEVRTAGKMMLINWQFALLGQTGEEASAGRRPKG
jgi:hypothetical protein